MVHVGTHAVSSGSRRTLTDRLGQHRGQRGGANPGGGNHRGSVFRLHVGTAIIDRAQSRDALPLWGERVPRGFRPGDEEHTHERAVSECIRVLPFLWIEAAGDAGPESVRSQIERRSIALLSNQRRPFDPPSARWLGNHSAKPQIRESGLWNVDHVDLLYDGRLFEFVDDVA